MIAQGRDITSLGDLFFADWKHHFRDTVFAKEGPGPKNHSEIGSDILHHKVQEMDRKSKGMIAMYSSNYRSTPGLCLPLILLSFEGSSRAGMMGEEGVPPLCSFKPGVCTKETAHQGIVTFVKPLCFFMEWSLILSSILTEAPEFSSVTILSPKS